MDFRIPHPGLVLQKYALKRSELRNFFLIVIGIILLDQILKSLVTAFVDKPITIIPGLVTIRLAENSGVAFGMLSAWPILVLIITGIILFGFLYALPFITRSYILPFALIVGGAFGNFIDRLSYGYVIDYVSVSYFSVFNLADTAIFCGVVWILVLEFRKDKKKK